MLRPRRFLQIPNGKTTTTLNLAHSLQSMGKKVLTIDFDSQAIVTGRYCEEHARKANSDYEKFSKR